MVKIRLRRMGAKKAPFYRVVVADSRFARDGRFIEEIGYYDPTKNPSVVSIDADKAKQWLSNGAQPTDTVRELLKQYDMMQKMMKKVKRNPKGFMRGLGNLGGMGGFKGFGR